MATTTITPVAWEATQQAQDTTTTTTKRLALVAIPLAPATITTPPVLATTTLATEILVQGTATQTTPTSTTHEAQMQDHMTRTLPTNLTP